MKKRIMLVLLATLLVFTLVGTSVLAKDPDKGASGVPFQELWEALENLTEEVFDAIEDLQEQIDGFSINWDDIEGIPDGFADDVDDVGGAGDGHSLDAADGDPIDAVYVDNNGNVGIGTTAPQGKLHVMGDIYAGNSDLYFTKSNHNHTGIGNTEGYAAIENAADYNALMILGRAGTTKGRYVRLWDYIQVNGGMDITGNVGIGTTSPSEKLEVDGHAIADPIAGRWRCDSIDTGAGNWQWDSQIMNTEPTILHWTAGQADRITIAKAGYYLVSASVMKSMLSSGEQTSADIRKNGSTIAVSYTYASGSYHHHDLSVVDFFAVGDVVQVYNPNTLSNRYGTSSPYSVLSIYRLN